MNSKINIALIDDDPQWFNIIKDLLIDKGFFISFYDKISSFKKSLLSQFPDIALIDIRLPSGAEGFELLHWIKANHPRLKSIVLTAESKDAIQAILKGAEGFITKAEWQSLELAINEVSSGYHYLSNHGWEFLSNQLYEHKELINNILHKPLTPRELDVISCYREAKSRKDTAKILCVTEGAVKKHNSSILKKLCLKRMQEVIKKFGNFF